MHNFYCGSLLGVKQPGHADDHLPHLTLRFRLGSVIPLLLLFRVLMTGYRENFTNLL